MKDIKPGVLSKIVSLTEKDPSTVGDDKLKRLVHSAKDIQEALLEYSSYKPSKKIFVAENETLNSKAQSMKNLVERILEFKYGFFIVIVFEYY